MSRIGVRVNRRGWFDAYPTQPTKSWRAAMISGNERKPGLHGVRRGADTVAVARVESPATGLLRRPWTRLLRSALTLGTMMTLAAPFASVAAAQDAEPGSREALIEREQAEKVPTLHPYVPGTGEAWMNKAEEILVNGDAISWHPFFENAYAGGGLTVGMGYLRHVNAYDTIDVRGSYTAAGYKRAEVAYTAPRLFHRRGSLEVVGGWREATQVGFYGTGMDTTLANRADYDFQQPYASALLTFWPTRGGLKFSGGVEITQWSQRPGQGPASSVERIYTPVTLPGLGADVTYVHSQGTVGFDWRTSPGYSRRGGLYQVTLHDYADRNTAYGFQRLDYEAIQHVPILREAWVISLHGLAQTTVAKDGQQIPFFMLPSVGGGSSLRGLTSWRFRDRDSLLLQAEWRVMVNRFFDTAVFYEAGKVAARAADLDLRGLKSDVGFGLRFHGPAATPLRLEVARSSEGLALIFASSAIF
jgi:hypothetical protein